MVCDATLETTYCVLDGVDECEEASLEILLGKFAALVSAKTDASSACHLNLLIVSRGLPDFIPNLLSSFARISLDPDASVEVRNDINIFIEAKVEELSRYRQYPALLRLHVEKTFQDRAGGTFLWIGIVAKALRKYKSTEVEKALGLFPPGLNELYARILLQIDPRRRKIAARMFRWVVMAVRPLTLSELSLAIEPTVDPSILTNRDERIRDQMSYCGDFLMINDDRTVYRKPKEYQEYQVYQNYQEYQVEMRWVSVGLIHQSAKDYLLRQNQDSNPVLEDFRVKEDVANLEIARRCLDYLQSGALEDSKPDVLSDEEHLSRFPLLSYAVPHWHEHAKILARSADVFDSSHPFWKKKSEIRTSWLKAYWKFSLKYRYHEYKPPESFSKLHLASFLGLFSLVEKLVLGKGLIHKFKRMLFLNKIDSHRMTGLMWAARRGHEAVVQLLLKQGANTEITDVAGRTALILAAEDGREAVVQLLLLEEGVNINAKDFHSETALMIAIEHRHETIIQLLLEKKVDIEVQNIDRETALIKAAESGHVAVIQLLLKQGADINVQALYGATALMKAAESGYVAVVQLLLKQGADVNVQDSYGETALMSVAKGCSENSAATIRLLLEKGADTNAVDEAGETALTMAEEQREEAEDGKFLSKLALRYPESFARDLVAGRKSNLDSVIQILTLHPQTQSSI